MMIVDMCYNLGACPYIIDSDGTDTLMRGANQLHASVIFIYFVMVEIIFLS